MRVPVRLGMAPLVVEDALFTRGYRPLGLQASPSTFSNWGDTRAFRDPVRFAVMGGPVGIFGLGQEEIPLDQPAPGESPPQIAIALPPPDTIIVPDFSSRVATPPFVPASTPSPVATGSTPSFFQILPAILTAGAIAARTAQQIIHPTSPTATSPFFNPAFAGRSVPFSTLPPRETPPRFPGPGPSAAPWYTQTSVLVGGGLGVLLILFLLARR